MRFEHLVEINDPAYPELFPLSRRQLWQGLVRRARDPRGFLQSLDQFSLREEASGELQRTLVFGRHRVHDRVLLTPPDATLYEVPAGVDYPASRLLIRIEEPTAGNLFLRFVYELAADGLSADATTDELRRQAYYAADLDTVSRLRTLAAMGELG